MGDRGEGRNAAVAIGMTQSDQQGAVAAHRMAADATTLRIDGKMGLHQLGQLLHHIGVHLIVAAPGVPGGVHIKTSPMAEVPAPSGVPWHLLAPGAGVWSHQRQTQGSGAALGTGLLHEVFIAARQPGKPIQGGHCCSLKRLGRQKNTEGHLAIQDGRAMAVATLQAAKATALRQ